MELRLGSFGDLRLEKGGPFWRRVCLNAAAGDCVSDDLAAIAPERCGSRDFCATDR